MKTQTTLKNGLRIVTVNRPGVYSTVVNATVGVGSRFESANEAGLAHFVEHLVFKGTETFPTAADVNGSVSDVGGKNSARTGNEYTNYEIQVLAGQLPLALEIVCEMVSRPLFEPDEVGKERGPVLDEMRMRNGDVAFLGGHLLRKLLFPGHPLARSTLGFAELIETVSADAVTAFHKKHYTAANIVISVVGVVDHGAVVRQVKQLLGGMPSIQVKQPSPVPANPSTRLVRSLETPSAQAHMFVVARADLNDNDKLAAHLLAAVLGLGMNSRLVSTIRAAHSLAYGTEAFMLDYSDTGVFGAYVGSGKDDAPRALELLLIELLLAAPVTGSELATAKEQLVAQAYFTAESSQQVAFDLGQELLLHGEVRPLTEQEARIRAVKLADVRRVKARLLQPENLRLAVIGPRSAITSLSRLFRTLIGLVRS